MQTLMHKTLAIGALLLTAANARAEVVTLAELEAKAVQNRPALARDKARTKVADADLRRAASAYYPQFVLRADSTIGPGRQLLRVGSDGQSDQGYLVQGTPPIQAGSKAVKGYPRSGVELAANATLYDFGRTQAATRAGREGHAAAVASEALTEEELRNVVRGNYLAWLLSSEMARLSEQTLQDARDRRARVEALVTEGVRPKGELTPARADELLAQLERERGALEREQSKLALENAVGSPLSNTAEPDATLLQADTALPDQSEQDARMRRALLQRFKAAQSMADAQSKLNRPQLGIGATVGIRVSTQNVFDLDAAQTADDNGLGYNPKLNTTVFPLYGAGLTLTVPLWDGGFTSASVQAARAKVDEAKADLEELNQEQSFAQQKATLDLTHATTRLQTAEELVTICETRLKDAEAGFEAGVGNIEQVGQARALLRRAQTETLLAKADRAAAKLRMVRKDVPKSGP